MSPGEDPIEAWRDVSRRSALATGYRPRSRALPRPSAVTSIGALAVVVLLVAGGLALRSASPIRLAGAPVVASAEDANFRLTLTTPRGTYGPSDAIEPVATVTYLGPAASETMFHATEPIGFRIEEVGGEREMGGGSRLPCRSTELAKGASAVVLFGKSGSPTEDPRAGFDLAWYQDPVLRLPVGSWRILAYLDVQIGSGGCGGEPHRLTVENVIQMVAGDAVLQTPIPSPSAKPDVPVVATAEDGNFRFTLTTPHGTYGPNDAIEPVATVTYLGPRASETMFHGSSPIGFRIEEVGGERGMGGGMDTPCNSTELAKGASAVIPFAKAGSPDDPKAGFDSGWYQDPVLRLPGGTWRIVAYLDVTIGKGTCGGEPHQMTVENVVRVAAQPSEPAPTLSADAATALEIVRKYEDGLGTGHFEPAWGMLSPWSKATVGAYATFVDAEAREVRMLGATVDIGSPSRDPSLLDPALLGERAVDLAATADPARTYVVSINRPGVDGTAEGTRNLVLAPAGVQWQIWLDIPPQTYGGFSFPSGCAAYGLSGRRCEAVVTAAASNLGFDRSTAIETVLMPEPGCGGDPLSANLGGCLRTTDFVAGVQFETSGGTKVRTNVFCGVASPTLVCSETPGIQAVDLHGTGYWDVPCTGEAPDGCPSSIPTPTGAAAAAGRELRIGAIDVPVGALGHREVEIGTAVLVDGIVQEARFTIIDQTQVGFLLDPGVVQMKLLSTVPGRPPFDNAYQRGTVKGQEEVRVVLVFDVAETGPDAVIHVTDVLVK